MENGDVDIVDMTPDIWGEIIKGNIDINSYIDEKNNNSG